MPEMQQRGGVRHLFFHEIQSHELPHRIAVVDRVFHALIRQVEPALHQVHPQHLLDPHGRSAALSLRVVRCHERDPFIPWEEWVAFVAPYYPKGKRGRPTMGIEKMLRMYLMQCWFNLSDEGVEDAIYDSYAMRKFMRLDFMKEQVPDATTLLHFRHLLEQHGLGERMFQAIRDTLEHSGHIMRGGTIVDATIIEAPGST